MPELGKIQELVVCPIRHHWECRLCSKKWKTRTKNLFALTIKDISSYETICQKLEDYFGEYDVMGCCEGCHIQKLGLEFACPTLRGHGNGKEILYKHSLLANNLEHTQQE